MNQFDNLVEMTDIDIDTKLNYQKRITNYLEKIKNPYYFLCDDVIVKISFSSNGKTLSELLEQYFKNLI